MIDVGVRSIFVAHNFCSTSLKYHAMPLSLTAFSCTNSDFRSIPFSKELTKL